MILENHTQKKNLYLKNWVTASISESGREPDFQLSAKLVDKSNSNIYSAKFKSVITESKRLDSLKKKPNG